MFLDVIYFRIYHCTLDLPLLCEDPWFVIILILYLINSIINFFSLILTLLKYMKNPRRSAKLHGERVIVALTLR